MDPLVSLHRVVVISHQLLITEPGETSKWILWIPLILLPDFARWHKLDFPGKLVKINLINNSTFA